MAVSIDVANLGGATADPNAGTTIALTTTSAVAAGARVVLIVGGYGGSADPVTGVSGGGLTWTVDDNWQQTGSPLLAFCSAPAPSGLASGQTFTATYTASSQVRTIGACSLLGVDTTDPVGNTSHATGVWGVGGTAWTTSSVTIEAGSILIGASWNETTNAGSTPGSTELHDVGHSNGFGQVAAYRIEASAGSYAVTGTWGASGNYLHNVGLEYRASAAEAEFSAGGFDPRNRVGRERGRFPLRGAKWY